MAPSSSASAPPAAPGRPSAAAPTQAASSSPSTSGRSSEQMLDIHGTPVPVEWLVQRHDSKRFPDRVLMTRPQQERTLQDRKWAQGKDQWLAAAAAGVHLTLFAYNLAFWGSEGMPPDRYWPANARLKMGIKPGRYGNIDGTKRIWYDNLSALEGFK